VHGETTNPSVIE